MDILSGFNFRRTAQQDKADPRQARNSAGGFAFTVTPEIRLRRFLVLGTEGGTYYASARELTNDNADLVVDFARNRPLDLVREIVAISQAGRAPRQNPALFALAAAASLGDDTGRAAALEALPDVARTGTHLFLFAGYVEQFRGWGRGLRRAVGNWYLTPAVDQVAYQAIKYRQRYGWTHRDLLRLAHPVTEDAERRGLFDYIVRGTVDAVPAIVEGFERAQHAGADIPALVREYGLSWEMLPDSALGRPETWEALLDAGMPQTALLRQLPRLTRLGLLTPMGSRTAAVAAQLTDVDRLTRARVHPISVLLAQRTYASGRSVRGESEWSPSAPIVDALDATFYAAFETVEPSNTRHLLALDVSGSMTAPISGMPLSAREASTALALVTAATEPDHHVVGFTGPQTWFARAHTGLSELPISPRQRLDDALRAVSDLPFGRTDCALPMTWALENRVEVDVFTVYTDNETWAGRIHPHQALQQYRREINPQAQLIVVGMTATDVTIADPTDAGMLDIAGFDSATPSLISGFARGDI